MRRHLAVLVVAWLVAGGCGQGAAGPPADRTVLRLAIPADVGTLDPAQVYAASDIQVAQNLFDGLVRYDDALNVVPDLAESLPAISADRLTYTFRLRRDAAFSNGDRVTSRDVLYSWNRAMAAGGAYATNLSLVAGLSAPDDRTVVAKLSQPAGWFLSAIALPGTGAAVVDQAVVQRDPQGWWTRPETLVGTGPYRLSARTPGRSLEFEAVPGWWGAPQPSVRRLVLDVLPEAGARENAYELGRYDLNGFGGGFLALGDLNRIRSTPALARQLRLRPGIGSTWVNFNLVHDAARVAGGPFLSALGRPARDLRLAFALAVDKRRLTAAVCRDLLCVPATGGLIPTGLRGSGGDGSDPLAGFDLERARALLRSADPDGTRTKGLSFVFDGESQLYQAAAENLRGQWLANLGVKVEVLQEPHEQLLKDARAGRFVLSRAGWQADFDHPADWYDNLFGKLAGCPDASCGSGFDSAQYDLLLAQADAGALPDALPLYRQLGQLLSAEAAYVPLFYSERAYMVKPYVRGAGANNLLEFTWNEYRIS